MTPSEQTYRSLAIAIVEGETVPPERQAAVLHAAGKTATDLDRTIGVMAGRKIWATALETMATMRPELDRALAFFKAKGAAASPLEAETVRRVSARFETEWNDAANCLMTTADPSIVAAAEAAKGTDQYEDLAARIFDWKNGKLT